MKIFVKLTSVLILILLISSGSEARGDRGGRQRMFKDLDLTPEQTEQLSKMREGQKDSVKALRQKKKEIRKEFKKAMASDASESDLRRLHQEKFQIKKQLADARFEKTLAIRKILTPEQRLKFGKFMQNKRRNRRGGRRSRGEEDQSL